METFFEILNHTSGKRLLFYAVVLIIMLEAFLNFIVDVISKVLKYKSGKSNKKSNL